MPSYDFKCVDCGWRGVLSFRTYAEYDTAAKQCPRCQSLNMMRTIKRVAVLKGRPAKTEHGADLTDDTAFQALMNAENDPAALGRVMRQLGEESGEPLAGEFTEVVERLERGEDPKKIEKSLAEQSPSFATDHGLGGDAPLPYSDLE
jgi:hypothetical protein